MINYIIRYQNKFVYAHLFQKNLVDLVEKGGRFLLNLEKDEFLKYEYFE